VDLIAMHRVFDVSKIRNDLHAYKIFGMKNNWMEIYIIFIVGLIFYACEKEAV
jgi:hypothetical protein